MATSSSYRRGTTSLSNLISQRRLDGDDGIVVKLSPQNQLYLNVPRPCRVRIPASMLQERVTGFTPGTNCVLKVVYRKKNRTYYHRYDGKEFWVPTAPSTIGKPNEVMTIDVAGLDRDELLKLLTELRLRNERRRSWMADEATLTRAPEASGMRLLLEQNPAIEGFNRVELQTTPTGNVDVKHGVAFVDLTLRDVFHMPVRLRVNQDGTGRSFMGIIMHGKHFPIRFASFDGIRLRLIYDCFGGESSSVVYLNKPSMLYALGELVEAPPRYMLPGVERAYLVNRIEPIRTLERQMLRHGLNYEIGRMGAEISYAIISKKFGCSNLVLSEPARGGKDLHSLDYAVAVQSRLLGGYNQKTPEWKIRAQLRKMIRKLKIDFWYTKRARVGYAVLSYWERGGIQSVVAEVIPVRSEGRGRDLNARSQGLFGRFS